MALGTATWFRAADGASVLYRELRQDATAGGKTARVRAQRDGEPHNHHLRTWSAHGARRGQACVNDARLWHPWLRINRVLRVMLHERWSAEAWSVVRVEFRKAL